MSKNFLCPRQSDCEGRVKNVCVYCEEWQEARGKNSRIVEILREEASKVADSLVEKGMIINISQSDYESLHPEICYFQPLS